MFLTFVPLLSSCLLCLLATICLCSLISFCLRLLIVFPSPSPSSSWQVGQQVGQRSNRGKSFGGGGNSFNPFEHEGQGHFKDPYDRSAQHRENTTNTVVAPASFHPAAGGSVPPPPLVQQQKPSMFQAPRPIVQPTSNAVSSSYFDQSSSSQWDRTPPGYHASSSQEASYPSYPEYNHVSSGFNGSSSSYVNGRGEHLAQRPPPSDARATSYQDTNRGLPMSHLQQQHSISNPSYEGQQYQMPESGSSYYQRPGSRSGLGSAGAQMMMQSPYQISRDYAPPPANHQSACHNMPSQPSNTGPFCLVS